MSNWEERFDERFKLEPYEPRDRTTEQVRHIVNDDYAGEIIADHEEERKEYFQLSFNSWLEDEIKPFIKSEMTVLLDNIMNDIAIERSHCLSASHALSKDGVDTDSAWMEGQAIGFQKALNYIKKAYKEMNHENGIK